MPQTYVYSDEGSYDPLARIDGSENPEIYWFHNQPNGTPERLTDAEGQLRWEGQNSAWGKLLRESSLQGPGFAQNLRMQGQYLDRETGLHSTLFRYYDPDCGRFTQPDPIGLLGGLNLYQYAPNPLSWIDPLGLVKCRTIEYRHRQKPGKVTNINELRRQIIGQIRAFNKILKKEGMVGLKKRIDNYGPSLEKEGRGYVRGLGAAGDG